jgi:hypothetical protein
VFVPVVGIGEVGVLVDERRVNVRMGVRLRDRISVSMPVVLVVDVRVLVLVRLMRVRVRVASAQHERDSGRHERARDEVSRSEPVPEQRY